MDRKSAPLLIPLVSIHFSTPAAGPPQRHIADVICENMRDVPPEIMAAMPGDGASQHDHYIYGWPKREA
jgi:hypothetical protein